jgi:hypothetical protein
MLQQTTNLGKPKATEYHAVLDEHAPGDGSIGSVLAVFPNAVKARRFANNVKEAARLAKAGSALRWAFAPSVDTDTLQRIISSSPNVRPRLVQLTEDLPIGAHVHAKLHLAHSGPPRGSLRCL